MILLRLVCKQWILKNMKSRANNKKKIFPSVSSSFHPFNQVSMHVASLINYLVEGLSIVNANDRADHFWNNDHVAQVCLDNGWLLKWRCFLLGLSQLLDKSHGFAFEAASKTTTGTAVHQL